VERDSSFLPSIWMAVSPTQVQCQWVLAALSPGVKQLGCNADHSCLYTMQDGLHSVQMSHHRKWKVLKTQCTAIQLCTSLFKVGCLWRKGTCYI